MNHTFNRQFTSLLLIASMIGSPFLSAYADDYSDLCTNPPKGATISDQTKSYCDQARSGKIAKDYNVAKEVIMTTATAALVVAGATLYGSALCPAISYGATGAGMGLDIASSVKLGNISSSLVGTLTAIGTTMATSKTSIVDSVKAFKSPLNQKGATDSKAQRNACFTAAVSTGIQAATAELGRESSAKAEASALQSIKDLNVARNGSSGFVVGSTGVQGSETGSNAKGATVKDAVADANDCSGQSGNSYLKCLGTHDAEIAAITNSPDAMNALESTLGGQSLGDLAKNYSGNSPSELANYVANAMGAGSTGADALAKALDASKATAIEADLYHPGSYVASNNKSSGGAGDAMDFNKMMEGMLKSLNPDGTDKKGEDPSLIVFRTLDLLPPDKIEANKDISLFARIGYRYRKKANDVEHLNWATDANQAANSISGAPISSSVATNTTATAPLTTTGASATARAPASNH